jgi:hypothetical protein
MKFFLIFFLLIANFAHAHEKQLKTRADNFAYANFSKARNHPWPFAVLSIGHNMQSYQNYGTSPYWHDGLDIRSRPDELITSATAGRVVNIENYVRGNALYWEVAILDDEGFVWKYHHVDQSSIPADIYDAYKKGSRIKAGTLLGKVVRWPVTTFGEVYHHLHLLIVASDQRYINPFLMMEALQDNQSPVIHSIGLTQNHKMISGNVISGEHGLFLETSDLVYHERFILPPHKITYRLNGEKEKVVWEFIHLPSGSNDTDYIRDFYLPGTCGNYSCRRFYINLNFTLQKPRGGWKLNPGDHEVEVQVEDLVGNKSSGRFNWKVL